MGKENIIVLIAIICTLVVGCGYSKPKYSQSNPAVKLPDSINKPFNELWIISRDCLKENNMPVKTIDKESGFIKTEMIYIGFALTTGFQVSIELNRIDDNTTKIYFDGKLYSDSPLSNSHSRKNYSIEIDNLKGCIASKLI